MKLENLQPTGSFKIRPIGSAVPATPAAALARELLAGTLTVSLAEVAGAIRHLVEHHHAIAEGAGALPVAAALSGRHPYRTLCALVSGGNLDPAMLSTILSGGIPR